MYLGTLLSSFVLIQYKILLLILLPVLSCNNENLSKSIELQTSRTTLALAYMLYYQQSFGHNFRKRSRVKILRILVSRNNRLLVVLEFNAKYSKQDTGVWWQLLVVKII